MRAFGKTIGALLSTRRVDGHVAVHIVVDVLRARQRRANPSHIDKSTRRPLSPVPTLSLSEAEMGLARMKGLWVAVLVAWPRVELDIALGAA